ncbi:MAG: M20/M25/M40 family metallo-hydrolase [Planctomycetota bacterium]
MSISHTLVFRLVLLSIILPGACSPLPLVSDYSSVTAPGESFGGERAFAHVKVLAAPEMEGRQSGLPGGDRAEAYAAEEFRQWGLAPAGDDHTYLQTFPLLVTELRSATMALLDTLFSPIELTLHEDFFPLMHSGSGELIGEAVFVGYGVSKPEKGWDDYGQEDMRGKVVILIREHPPVPGQDWSAEYSRDYTVKEAVNRGAAAVLFLQDKNPIHGAAIMESTYNKDLPMAYIAEHVAETLLAGRGETLDTYKEALKKAPKPLFTGNRLRIRFHVPRIPSGRAANVIGCIPGSDPLLSDEYIVIGGHLDHIGMCPGGFAFAGADDNASGSAVVLELARAFAESPVKPARSLLFALFAAEEQGLLGSEYLAAHLPVEKEKVALMLNFDMEGHGNGKVGFGGSEAFPVVWRSLLASEGEGFSNRLYLSRAWGGGSDQASFSAQDVPAFSIWSQGGHHFYHTVHDIPAYIKPEVLHAVGTVSETAIRFFADWPDPLADRFQKERRMLSAACQVDFSSAWTGVVATEEDLSGPVATGSVFVHGALWNLEIPSWLDRSQSGLQDMDPHSAAALFSRFSKLKPIAPPATVGKDFNDVRRNTGRQQFTLLPCITPRTLGDAGPQGAAFLTQLGAAFLIADDSGGAASASIGSQLPVVARLEEASSAPAGECGPRIVVCSGDPGQWLESAEKLKNGDMLFVIRLESESMSGESLKKAVHALSPARCHFDLTGIKRDCDDRERMKAVFQRLRSLIEAGMDPAELEKLIGGNLVSWPG